MRTGHDYAYRFASISWANETFAVAGVGGPVPILAHLGRGRRPSMVVAPGDTFAFTATRHDRLENPSAHAAIRKGDLALFLEHASSDGCHFSRVVACDFRLSPKWPLAAEIDRLFKRIVLGRAGASLRLLEPPAVWARELPVLTVFPITSKKG